MTTSITFTLVGVCDKCGATATRTEKNYISELSLEDWVYDHECKSEGVQE